MPHATSGGGVRVHYEVHPSRVTPEPERPPVVLVQGLGLSSRFWFDQPRLISQHEERPQRVVVLDNRGTGRSDRPRGPYTMAQMADDVAAVIEAAGLDAPIVVGISMGGMIAQHVAMRHPGKVRGLVLLATTPGLPWATPPGPQALATLLAIPLLGKRGSSRLQRLLLPASELHRGDEHLAKWPAALAIDPTTMGTFLSQFYAAVTNWTGGGLAKIACPTVVVTGAEDILVPPRNSRQIARRIPKSHLQILPDVAHAVPLLRPDIVWRSLQKLEEMGVR